MDDFLAKLSELFGFLVDELKGGFHAFWGPAWKTEAVGTTCFTLLLLYPVIRDAETAGHLALHLVFLVGYGAYLSAFVAIPVGIWCFGWRLFGWGTVLTLLLAPPAFILTGALLNPWMLELGANLVTQFSTAFEQQGGLSLTQSLTHGGGPSHVGGTGAAPSIGGGPYILAILLIPLAICAIIDLARISSFAPTVLGAATAFLGAVAIIFVVACLAALVLAVPILSFFFIRRLRERYENSR